MIEKTSNDKALELYKNKMINDFPKNELPPFSTFSNIVNNNLIEGYIFKKNNEEKGYTFIRKVSGFVFIMYFAIDKNNRGQGYGKSFIEELKQYFKDENAIILEAESNLMAKDEQELNIIQKRLKFYKALEFKIIDKIKYVLYGVDYKILYYPLKMKEIDNNIIPEIAIRIYSEILKDMKKLEIEILK